MLAACSEAATEVPTEAPTGTPGTLTEAPEGLSFSVYQTRFDANARQLQFHIDNQSGETVTFTGVRLDSPLFDSPVTWQGESTVEDGRARDLKASLPAAACPRPMETDATASFDFVLGDGRNGTVTVVPGDPMEILASLTAADCLDAALQLHADLEIISLTATGKEGEAASMVLQLTPSSAPGELHLETIEGTNLLALLDDDGTQVDERSLDLTVSADSPPQQLVLRLEPTRCDPHAIAEDKQGTLFPLVFTTSEGEGGKVRIAAPDAIRSQLYAFVADFCQF